MPIYIDKIIGGSINVTIPEQLDGHSYTRVTYSDGTTQDFDIVGEITADDIPQPRGRASSRPAAGGGGDGGGGSSDPSGYHHGIEIVSIDGGNTVTSIGDMGFANIQTLQTVHFPYVTRIGDGAFAACGFLHIVDCPNAVVIGDLAFA